MSEFKVILKVDGLQDKKEHFRFEFRADKNVTWRLIKIFINEFNKTVTKYLKEKK